MIFLPCTLIVAAWTDVRTGRISNRLIGLGLLVGCIHNCYEYGWPGVFYFFIQISFPVLVFYLLFLMRALGAGDIKLFSIICSCIGLRGFIKVAVYSFLIGAVFSFLTLLRNKNLHARLAYFSAYVKTALHTKCIPKYDYTSDGKENFIHFSVAILFAYVFYACSTYR